MAREIKFNQNAWLKPYIHMNTDLRKKAKRNFILELSKILMLETLLFVMEIPNKWDFNKL